MRRGSSPRGEGWSRAVRCRRGRSAGRGAVDRSARRARGGGARAADLHVLAARIVERAWRIEGRGRTRRRRSICTRPRRATSPRRGRARGLSAGRSSRATSRATPRSRTASCTAWSGGSRRRKRAARGDLGACAKSVGSALAALEAFRPPARVIEAIDEGLAGEGAVLPVDAGNVVNVAPRIVGIEAWPGDESSRVVISLDRPAHFRAGDESVPGGRAARTFVELDGVDVGTVARDHRWGAWCRAFDGGDDERCARGARPRRARVPARLLPAGAVPRDRRHRAPPAGGRGAWAAERDARGARPGARRLRPGRDRPRRA